MDFYMKLAAQSQDIQEDEHIIEEPSSRTDALLEKMAMIESAGRGLAKQALLNPAGLAGQAVSFGMRNPRLAAGAVGAGVGYATGGDTGAVVGGLAGAAGGASLRNAIVGKNPLMGQGAKQFAQQSMRANKMPIQNPILSPKAAPAAPVAQKALPAPAPQAPVNKAPTPVGNSTPSVVVDPTARNTTSRGSIQRRGVLSNKVTQVVPGGTASGVINT